MIDNTLLYKKSMAETCTQRGHYLTKVGRNRIIQRSSSMPGMYYSGLGCFMVSLTLYSKCFNFFVFDFTILCIFPDERSSLVSIKKYGKLRCIRVLGKLYYNPRYSEVTVTTSTFNLSSPTHYNNTLPRREQN